MADQEIQYSSDTPVEEVHRSSAIPILVPEQENELQSKILKYLAISNALSNTPLPTFFSVAFLSLFFTNFWILRTIVYYTWPLGILFALAYITEITYFQMRTKLFLDSPYKTQLAWTHFALKLLNAIYFTFWLNFIDIRLPLYILMTAFIYQYLKENDVSWEKSDLLKQGGHITLLVLLLVSFVTINKKKVMLSHGKETVLIDFFLLPIFCCFKSVFVMSMIGKVNNYEYLKKEHNDFYLSNLHSDSEQIFFCELFSCSKLVT